MLTRFRYSVSPSFATHPIDGTTHARHPTGSAEDLIEEEIRYTHATTSEGNLVKLGRRSSDERRDSCFFLLDQVVKTGQSESNISTGVSLR